jgi:branched-chain amino acid transport system substrate-binding protein
MLESGTLSRRRALQLSGAGITAGLAGCFGNGGEQETYNIGWFTALSGSLATFSEDTPDAVELLVSEWNDDGGLQGTDVEISVFDTQSDAETAIRHARDFIQDGGDVLGLSATTPEVTALQDQAQRNEIPMVSTSSGGESLVENCNEFSFRGGTATNSKAAVSAPFAVENLGSDVFLLNYDYSYGYEVEENWTEGIEGAGGEVVGTARQALGEGDFSAPISQIESADPDWVLSGVAGADAVAFITQFNQQGIDVPIHTHTNFEQTLQGLSEDVIANQDIYTNRAYVYTVENEMNNDFVDRFREEIGNPPGLAEGVSYKNMDAFLNAASEADSLDAGDVVSTFSGYDTESITGPYTMRACDHQGQFALYQTRLEGLDDEGYPAWEVLQTTPKEDFLLPCEETGCDL